MAAFRYWRLRITRWNYAGSPSTGATGDVRIGEVELHTAASVKWPTSSLTAASAPSPFVASASSDDGTRPGWRAFDGNAGDSNRWISASAPGAAQWLAIDLGAAVDIVSIKIAPDGAASIGYHPLDFSVEASTTGAFAGEHEVIAEYLNLTAGWANNTLRTFSVASVAGTVLDDAGAPAARTVRSYDRASGALIAETTSNGTTGAYRIAGAITGETQVVVLDDAGGAVHDDLIKRVTAS